MEMNVIATLQETWAAHLLDIVARLLNVKTIECRRCFAGNAAQILGIV